MAQPDMPPQPAHTGPQVIYVPPPSTNGMSTAAMVCGIVANVAMFACFTGIPFGITAIILGHVSLATSKRMNGLGRSKAITGLALGYGSLALLAFILIVGIGTTMASMPTQ